MFRPLTAAMCLAMTVIGSAQYALKYDQKLGGTAFDTFVSVAADNALNAYTIGNATNPADGTRINKVFKYSPTGTVVWSKEISIPNQTFDQLSTLVAVGPTGEVVVEASVADAAGVHTEIVRLNPTNGNILWQKTIGISSGAGRSFGLEIRGSHVYAGAADGTANVILLESQLDLATGNILWQKDLGAIEAVTADVRVDESGNVLLYRREANPNKVTVEKRDSATGNLVWTKSFLVESENAATFDVLESGKVIVALGGAANPRVLTLSAANGGTTRTDFVASQVIQVAAGLNNHYHMARKGSPIQYELRNSAGSLMATNTMFNPPLVSLSDTSGQFQDFNARSLNGAFEFCLERHPASAQQFFSIAGEDFSRNFCSVKNEIFMVGQNKVGDNTQARIVRVTQDLVIKNDNYSVLANGSNSVSLKVAAPGVLNNDAGWNGSGVVLTNQAQHGAVSLASDGSFVYQSDPGFLGPDTFSYSVTRGAVTKVATATIDIFALSSINANPATVIGGTSTTGTVFLTAATRHSPQVIALSDNSVSVGENSSVTIPAGAQNATFNITTVPVSADVNVTLTATLNGESKVTTIIVKRPSPTSVTVNPNSLIGGQPFSGTVNLNGPAPAAGLQVNLTHSGTEITLPVNVIVAAGATSATFNGTTQPRSTTVTHVITATSSGVSKTCDLTLNPGGLFSVTVTPSTQKGGLDVQGKVSVAGVAPSGGTLVNLSVNGSGVTIPANVTVPAGQQFVTFVIHTNVVVTTGTRTITATFGNVTRTCNLTLTP